MTDIPSQDYNLINNQFRCTPLWYAFFQGLTGGTGGSSGTVLDRFATGNTTGSTTSDAVTLTNWTISGAGGASVGMSGNTLVVAAPGQFSGFAIGGTTGSSSSTTFDFHSVTISGAGGASVGFSSNNILIVSAATVAASGTVQDRFAVGNTTGASSSAVGTLSIMSVSGAGGVSVGYDTASSGLLVISGPGSAATSMGLTAVGHTTGSTSSQTQAITAETLSFAGIVSGGFSGGSLVISAANPDAATLSWYDMHPIGGVFTQTVFAFGSSYSMGPLPLQAPLTFNEIQFGANNGLSLGNVTIQTAATSGSSTATRSDVIQNTFQAVIYAPVDGTTYSLRSKGSTTLGISRLMSGSRSGSSCSLSATWTFGWYSGSAGSTASTFSASLSSANSFSAQLTFAQSVSFSGNNLFRIPLAMSLEPAAYIAGFNLMSSTSATTNSMLSQSLGGMVLNVQLTCVSLFAGPIRTNWGATSSSAIYPLGWGILDADALSGSTFDIRTGLGTTNFLSLSAPRLQFVMW